MQGCTKAGFKRGVEGAIAKKIVNGQKIIRDAQLLWFVGMRRNVVNHSCPNVTGFVPEKATPRHEKVPKPL